MANLGVEVLRTFSAYENKDFDEMRSCYGRSLKIVDRLSVQNDIGNGKMELDILRQVLDDLVAPERKLTVTSQSMKSYFMPFMLRMAV